MFGIKTSEDRFSQLCSLYDKLLQNPLDISIAEKTCADAWHLTDWVFQEVNENGQKISKEEYRKSIYGECPEMRILHDIANTVKHRKLDREKANIIETEISPGPYGPQYSKEYDISRLIIHLENDTKIDLDDLIKVVIEFWRKKLKA